MNARGERRKAFVTGADGFLGSHVVVALKNQGFDVFESATQLSDRADLRSDLMREKWDVVFHLAGLSLPSDCERDPALAYAVNLCGTNDFASVCADVGFRGLFVFFSSAYVYSPSLEGSLNEAHPTAPSGVYGRTKLFAEQCLKDIAPTVPFSVLALRLFNHSHKSQRSDFFLPAMYKTISEAKPVNARVTVQMGDPNLSRDFSSLQDFRTSIASIAEGATRLTPEIRSRENGFKICNLCSGQARQLGNLVRVMGKKLGFEVTLESQQSRMRPGEPKVIFGDSSELNRLLNYEPPKRSDEEFIDLFLEDIKDMQ